MPELPEVQTTVDFLNKTVRGRKIVAAWYDWKKLKPVEKAVGYKIKNVRRVGKNILFYLGDSDRVLLVHQKMTGHILIGKWKVDGKKITPISPLALKERVNDYIHFILTLDNGQMIGLSDLRKFGKVAFGSREEIEKSKELRQLGPDVLAVSFEEFAKRVASRNKTIYQVLMDQTVISGIGNIYASEILFVARIHPFKSARRLSRKELKALWQASRKILKLALKLGGTSIADYRMPSGESGYYQKKRLIYQREGEKCFKGCGGVIKRAKKGGRSAFYCPRCQRL